MKKLYLVLCFLIAAFFTANQSYSQLQAFRLGAMNFLYSDTLGGTNNVLYFDIMMQHLNPEVSGPFEYAAGEYFFNFNPAIASGGTLTYRIIASDLPPAYRPVNASVSGSFLRMASNPLTIADPVISTIFPGTRIVRMRLLTSASSFANVPLNLSWRIPPALPATNIGVWEGIFARIITENGIYFIDSTNNFQIITLYNPAYNSVELSSEVNFAWSNVENAQHYSLQVSTDSLMSSLIINDSLIKDTSVIHNELPLGSTLFWRVGMTDSAGGKTYSYISKFFTKNYLISPAANATGLDQSLNFVWNNFDDAATYLLEVKEFVTGTTVFSGNTGADTTKFISGFEYNKSYLWRVKAFYAGGDSAETVYRKFSVRNLSVDLISPANNSFGNKLKPVFTWQPTAINFHKYFIKVSSDSLQDDVMIYDSTSGATSYTAGVFLNFDTRYYWSVSVRDSFSHYVRSAVRRFNTGNQSVDLYYPFGNDNNVAPKPLLSWFTPVFQPTRYYIRIFNDSDLTSIAFSDSTSGDTSIRSTTLAFDKKYYWNVTAKDESGHTAASVVRWFTTQTFLYSPENNAFLVNPVKFVWYKIPEATSYRLQVSRNNTFTDLLFSDSLLTDSVKSNVTLPIPPTEYFWRVSAKNVSGYFLTSGSWRIGIDSPVPVELASFSSSVLRNTIQLQWSTVFESNNSGFEIERKPSGVSPDSWTIVGQVRGTGNSNTLTNYSFDDKDLASGHYNYRLKQIDLNGNFEYFELQNEVVVGIPERYNLSQNYPNPFNPTTTINYELPDEGKVRISLFDLTGKEVVVIVNENKAAGYHSVMINASGLTSGVYFYVIRVNEFYASRKMMVLK